MKEDKNIHDSLKPGEEPLPVPPVEESWTAMRQQLDLQLPATRPWNPLRSSWYRHWYLPAVGALTVVTVLTWKTMHHTVSAGTIQPGQPPQTARSGTPPSETAAVKPSDSANTSLSSSQEPSATTSSSATTQSSTTAPSAAAIPSSTAVPSSGVAPSSTTTQPSATTPSSTFPASTVTPSSTTPSSTTAPSSKVASSSTPTRPADFPGRAASPAVSRRFTTRTRRTPGGSASLPPPVTGSSSGSSSASRLSSSSGSSLVSRSYAGSSPASRSSSSRLLPALAQIDGHPIKGIPAGADSLLRAQFRQQTKETITSAAAKNSAKKGSATTANHRHPSRTNSLSAGLSVTKNFPLGSRQAPSYNISGNSSTLLDYLPAPYLRYYLNDRFDIEGAVQWNSPQYVSPLTLDLQESDSITNFSSNRNNISITGNPQRTSTLQVSLKKLYYIDLPLLVRYRLAGQFYLGAGLQYSRLMGGAALRNYYLGGANSLSTDTLYNMTAFTLKDSSSLYGFFRKSDWRALLELSYDWRRLTFNIHYQVGLNSYGQPGSPAGNNRNGTAGISLQYDLWRRKK